MAKSKRLCVVLRPATHQLLSELADISGQSMSSLVSELVDEAAPSLRAVITAFEMAKKQPGTALELMAEQLKKATEAASQGELALDNLRQKHHKRRPKE